MKYRIAVDYSLCGVVDIKANSFDEALKKAYHSQTTDVYDKEYIDDSFHVNREMSEEFCKEDIGEVE